MLVATLVFTSGVVHTQQLSVRPVIGGFPADAGFAAGAELVRTGFAGLIDARVKAVASVKKYELLEVGFQVPELGRWLYFDVTSRYRNYPQEDFWGLGPNTGKDQRANYLLEDIDTTATVGTSVGKFRAGFSGGYVRINTGPGRDKRFPSVPEFLQQGPTYTHVGLFVEYESLDEKSDPHKGGKYSSQWVVYASSFQRYVVDLHRFVPISSTNRLAFRLQSIFTRSSRPEEVPFFMLPTAGGTDTVRGFNQYRFRDRNALVLNAEYRRPVTGFLDVVSFADAGRVFSRSRDLGLRYLHASGGLGTRVKFGNRVFFGVDLGFSREGAHLWFRSEHMF